MHEKGRRTDMSENSENENKIENGVKSAASGKADDHESKMNEGWGRMRKNVTDKDDKTARAQAKLDKKREKSIKNADPAVKKRKKTIRNIVIIVIIAAIAGMIVVSSAKAKSAGTPVTTVEASKGDIQQTLSTSGTVQSNTSKTYFADVSLPISKINVKEGDAVKKGDVLYTFDEDQLASQIQIQKSQMSADSGSYSSSLYKNNQTIGNLTEANTNLPIIEAQIANAQSNIDALNDKINDKKAKIAKEGAELQKSIDGIQNEQNKSEVDNTAETETVEDKTKIADEKKKKKDSMDTLTEQQLKLQDNTYQQSNDKEIQEWNNELSDWQDSLTELKTDKSTMESQQSTSKDAQLDGGSLTNLAQTEEVKKLTAQQTLDGLNKVQGGVKADFNGIITEVKVVDGSTSAVGTEVLQEQSLDDVSVQMSVTKYDIDKIKKGEKAKVTIAGKEYEGELTGIDQMAVKNASGTPVVSTTITIKNPDTDIYLGVEAKITLDCAKAEDVITLPIECVNTDQKGDFVYVVENGVLTRKDVTLGISSDEDVEVKKGLAVGDQVVNGVTADMTEGMKVTAVPQEDETGTGTAAAGTDAAE